MRATATKTARLVAGPAEDAGPALPDAAVQLKINKGEKKASILCTNDRVISNQRTSQTREKGNGRKSLPCSSTPTVMVYLHIFISLNTVAALKQNDVL